MGTRHLTMVIADGKNRIAQYGQWDGYPEGQGETVLKFLLGADLAKFKEKCVNNTKWVSQKEFDRLYKEAGHKGGDFVSMEVSNRFKEANPQLDRDMGAEVLEYVYKSEKKIPLKNDSEFINDGLFCEWAYVIDLDKGTLDIKNGADKTYKLDKLPTLPAFLNYFKKLAEKDNY